MKLSDRDCRRVACSNGLFPPREEHQNWGPTIGAVLFIAFVVLCLVVKSF